MFGSSDSELIFNRLGTTIESQINNRLKNSENKMNRNQEGRFYLFIVIFFYAVFDHEFMHLSYADSRLRRRSLNLPFVFFK